MYRITILLFVSLFAMSACQQKSTNQQQPNESDTLDVVNDTTMYGQLIDAAMSSIVILTDAGDTLQFLLATDTNEVQVMGGKLLNDRLAIVGYEKDGEKYASKVINLTTLLGSWTSIDKQFEIVEGGKVNSSIKAETSPWTTWMIQNGQLVFNHKDTFDIQELGTDSLFLENSTGIFAYKRQK